jgi:signal transduction histidine kinase
MSKNKPQVKKFDLTTASIEELERKIKELREEQTVVKKAGGGVINAKDKLKEISGELKKASNMHAKQSEKIKSVANSFSNGGVIRVKRRGTFKGVF